MDTANPVDAHGGSDRRRAPLYVGRRPRSCERAVPERAGRVAEPNLAISRVARATGREPDVVYGDRYGARAEYQGGEAARDGGAGGNERDDRGGDGGFVWDGVYLDRLAARQAGR